MASPLPLGGRTGLAPGQGGCHCGLGFVLGACCCKLESLACGPQLPLEDMLASHLAKVGATLFNFVLGVCFASLHVRVPGCGLSTAAGGTCWPRIWPRLVAMGCWHEPL